VLLQVFLQLEEQVVYLQLELQLEAVPLILLEITRSMPQLQVLEYHV